MLESVRVVGYGAAATRALAQELAALRRDDALGRVTVVAPSNRAGVSVRRVVASESGGLVNVSFVTPFGLAELLGRPVIAARGLRALTTPVLAAAIRAELRFEPGFFGPVVGHHATESALADLYAELSRARPRTLERIGRQGTERGRAVVDLFARVRARLRGYADETVLARAALDEVEAGGTRLAQLGPVVLYLPQPLAPSLADLLAAVITARPARAVIGLAGAADADATVFEHCGRLGIAVDPADGTPEPPVGTEVVTTSDPDDEVRAVVRRLMRAARDGTRLDRIGILYPASGSYARTVHEQLEAAGIPHNGPAARRLGGTVAGRTLRRLLALAGSELGRDDVVSLVTSAPVRDGEGRIVPGTRWDLLSRRAGVVGGASDWVGKLEAFARASTERAEQLEAEGAPEAGTAGPRGDGEQALALRDFVVHLAGLLEAGRSCTGWAELAAWARGALRDLLGDERARSRWPESETDAAIRVEAALERLAGLDALEPHPAAGVFSRALEVELDEPVGHTGRFGEGVVCGPLALGLGLDLDVVFVLGMAEGVLPAPRRDDSLVSDTDRELAAEGELPLRSHRVGEEHRAYLAAIASGAHERVLSFPRGDHRTGRALVPSRWLLDTVTARHGAPVHASDLLELGHPGVEHVPSFAAGLRSAPEHASLPDRDLAMLAAHVEAGRPAVAHHVAAACRALTVGLELQAARASSAFTVWDGNLAGCPVPSPATGQVLSATRLEAWATCPFRYFLASLLGLGHVEAPEEIMEISPLHRGSLVHEVLERFLAPVVALPTAARPRPGERWSAADRRRILEIASEACARYEALGVTGRPLLWRIHREAVLDDFLAFLDADETYRAETASVPELVEMSFGLDGSDPARIALPGGRELAFRGRADRVDRNGPGAVTVLDYKTGRGRGYEGLDDDPVLAGRRIQLPLYAEAACQQLGASTASAYYWLATRDGGFRLCGYELDPRRRARFATVLAEIVAGIEAGVFPAEPGEHNPFFGSHDHCRSCDFDRLCPADRGRSAEAKATAPELARFRALADGTDGWYDEEEA